MDTSLVPTSGEISSGDGQEQASSPTKQIRSNLQNSTSSHDLRTYVNETSKGPASEAMRPVMTFDDPIIEENVEKWRKMLASFLSSQSTILSLPEISSRIPTPSMIPRSIKLVDVLKFDPESRFLVSGEGSNIKVKFNFKLSDADIEKFQSQWRDQISKYLGSQSSAISLSDIGANVSKPFYLPNTVKLLETLQTDPLNRFVLSGEGNNMRARRVFRVDEEEIIPYVDEWRDMIAQYLSFQKTPSTLSDIGSSVARPPNLPPSVKLVEVLKLDPLNRFAMIGDGNYIRAHLRNRRGILPSGQPSRLGGSEFLSESATGGPATGAFPTRADYYYDGDSTGFSHSGLSGPPSHLNSPGNPSLYGPSQQQLKRFSFTSTQHAPLSQRALSRSAEYSHGGVGAQRSISRSAEYHHATGMLPRSLAHSSEYLTGTQPPRPIARSAEYPFSAHPPRPISRSGEFPVSNLSYRPISRSVESQWTGSQSSLNEMASDVAGEMSDSYNAPSETYRSPRLVMDGVDAFGMPGYRGINAQNSPFTVATGTTTSMGSYTRRENDFESSLLNATGFAPQQSAVVDPSLARFSAVIGPSSPEKRAILQRQQLEQKMRSQSRLVPEEDDVSTWKPRVDQAGLDGAEWAPSFGLFAGLSKSTEKLGSDQSLSASSAFPGLEDLRSVLPPPGLDIGFSKSSQFSSEYSNTPKSEDSPRLDEFKSSASVDEEGNIRLRSIAISQQSAGSDDGKLSVISSIDHMASDRILLSVWLPQVFEGFPKEQIDSFVNKMRDNGGFVTVKDLRDAQSNSQLTLELLQEVAEFKLGHFNRLKNGLASFN